MHREDKATVSAAENFEAIRRVAGVEGIDLVSSAPVTDALRETFHPSTKAVASGLRYAVVIGIRLSEPVLETVVTAPTWTYYHHYRTVNFALDQAARKVASECMRRGARAFPVPASQILDWERLKGHLSHREAGAVVGLGWQGRNNLLVNPEFGSQVRYTTILTDLELPSYRPYSDEELAGCGDCYDCIDGCPVGAIHDDPLDFELDRCTAQLRRFSKSERLNTMICGLCIRACSGTAGRKK